MAEINEFLSKKAETQLNNYQKKISGIATEYNKLGKVIIDYEKQQQAQSKTQQELIKQSQQLEKLNQQIAKTDQENLKAQQQLNKVLIEEEKINQQKIKTDQEKEKQRQHGIKTKKLNEKATKKQLETQKTLIQEYKTEIKTAKSATEQNKRLRDMRNKLDVTSKNYAKRLDIINNRINKNNKFTASQADSEKKRVLGIGKYSEALEGLGGRFSGVISGVKGLAGQFKKLLLNPVILAIVALVAVLYTLGKAFKNNRQFQEEWTKSLGAAKAEWNAFSNALTTGNVKQVFKNLRGIGETAFNLTAQMIKLTRETAIYSTKIAGSIAKMERFRIAADDATLSFQERADAADKAFSLEEKINEKQIELAKKTANNYIKQLKNQYQLGDVPLSELKKTIKQDELNQLTTLQQSYISALNERRRDEVNFEKFKRELRLDDFEQELDFIFDVSDKRKTANEKIIADETKTFTERKKLLNETTLLLDESFDQQIELFNTENKINIDRNKLLNLNNKESFEYARSLGMSERATNRLLEVIRERIAVISDLDEAQKGLNRSLEKDDKIALKTTDERIGHEKDATEQLIEEGKKRVENERFIQKQILDIIKMAEQQKLQARQAVFYESVNLVNSLANLNRAIGDSEIQDINQNYAKKIEAAEGNDELQYQLDKERANKVYQIQLKQAKLDKAIAIFNILTTAGQAALQIQASVAAAVAASAIGGPITAAAYAPFIALAQAQQGLLLASTAVQIGTVAATPLPPPPQFALGTDYSPSTFIAGEKGQELMFRNGQAFLTPNKATLYTGMEGTQILPNAQTESILNATYQANAGAINLGQLSNKMDEMIAATKESKANIILDKRGVWTETNRRGKLRTLANELRRNG